MGDLLLWCGVARVVLLVNEPNVRSEAGDLARSLWHCEKEVAMLVHEVMSTGLVTAKKTDTVRSVRDENDEPPLWYHSRC